MFIHNKRTKVQDHEYELIYINNNIIAIDKRRGPTMRVYEQENLPNHGLIYFPLIILIY